MGLDADLQQKLLVALKLIYTIDPLEMPELAAIALAVTKDDAQAQADLEVLQTESIKLRRMLANDGQSLALFAALRKNARSVRAAVDEAVQGFGGGRPFFSEVYRLASQPTGQQLLLVQYLYTQFAYTQYPKEDRSLSASRAIVVYKSNSAASASRRLKTGKKQDDLYVDQVTRTVNEMIAKEGLSRDRPKHAGCVERVTTYRIPLLQGDPFELTVPYETCN
jgi:hypothetical protein